MGEEYLTVAQCAARTGLTVRALHFYEKQGLLKSQRNAGGWRLYGSEELVRLNTVIVLKGFGVTLPQIQQILESSSAHFILNQTLELQISELQRKQSESARILQLTRSALDHVSTHRLLSIDELCNLIRSNEMNSSQTHTAVEKESEDQPVDVSLLSRYAGIYQLSDFTVWYIGIDNGKLTAAFTVERQPVLELRPLSETEFEIEATNTQLTFVCESQSAASKLVIHQYGVDSVGPRIDEATATQIVDRLRQRVEEGKPMPGSEVALRRLIDGVIVGAPDYDQMRPAFANLLRAQLPQSRATATFLGSVLSIEFQGVGSQGWDVYKVTRENGITRDRIMLADGKILGATTVVLNGPVSLGP